MADETRVKLVIPLAPLQQYEKAPWIEIGFDTKAEGDVLIRELRDMGELQPFFARIDNRPMDAGDVASALGATPGPTEPVPVTTTYAQPPGQQAMPFGNGDAPTDKQIGFAKRLGIDPTGHTKRSLSQLIDAKTGK